MYVCMYVCSCMYVCMYVHVYIYIYMCVCVCACVNLAYRLYSTFLFCTLHLLFVPFRSLSFLFVPFRTLGRPQSRMLLTLTSSESDVMETSKDQESLTYITERMGGSHGLAHMSDTVFPFFFFWPSTAKSEKFIPRNPCISSFHHCCNWPDVKLAKMLLCSRSLQIYFKLMQLHLMNMMMMKHRKSSCHSCWICMIWQQSTSTAFIL